MKRNLRSILSLALALALTLTMLAGCAGGGSDPTTAPTQPPATQQQQQTEAPSGGEPAELPALKIGVILTSTSNGYGLTVKQHLDAIGQELNVEFQYTGAQDVEAVTSAIENFIAAGCNGIIGGVTFSLPAELATCEAAGVYYTVACNAAKPEEYAEAVNSPYFVGAIGNNDAESTQSITSYLIETLGVETIALVNLPAGTSNMHDGRNQGILDAVAAHDGVELVAEARAYDLTASVQNVVAQFPDVDAIVACAGGIEECLQPIISAGKSGQIYFAGFREEAGAEDLFDDGTLAALGVGTSILPVFGFVNLYNALTADMLVPSEGEKTNLELKTVYVTNRDEYLHYVETNMENEPYTIDELKSCMTLFTPDATYADYETLLTGYYDRFGVQ